MIQFEVDGRPVPKARPRVINGHPYTPKTTRDWEELVGWQAKIAMAGKPPLEAELGVTLYFRGAHGSADLDNLVKAVLDGMNGIVYRDDKLISKLTAEKRRRDSKQDRPDGVSVMVAPLP